jgi:hypothetical protein
LFNKNKSKVVVKNTYLNAEEVSGFIGAAVSDLTSDAYKDNYYCFVDGKIDSYTLALYLDTDNSILDGLDTYKIIQRIKSQIDMSQFYDICSRIDEGVAYELSKKSSSLFGNMDDLDKATEKLNDLIKDQGFENVQKLMNLGIQKEAIEDAQVNFAKEQKAKKKVNKVVQ